MPPSIGPREQAATAPSAALQALRADMGRHLGTLVIVVDGQVARLLDITEDDDDLYFVVQKMGGRIILESAVGWIVPLKPCLPSQDYARMDHVFALNGAPPSTPAPTDMGRHVQAAPEMLR